MVMKRDDFEARKYPCKKCGQLKVRKRLGARKAPDYCPNCRVKVQKAQLKKAREQKEKSEPEGILITAPDGFSIRLQNEEEKRFYESRKAEYLREFDWAKSADLGLLARLLGLEVKCRRFENRITLKDNENRAYIDSIKQVQELQDNLGILRFQRKKKKEERTSLDIVQNLIKRFVKQRKEHLERFVFICKFCGKKNYLMFRNPNYKETGATPISDA